MIAGLLVITLWLFTGNRSLVTAGLLVILAGILFFVAGGIWCIKAAIENILARRPWRAWLPRMVLAVVLLFGNFPLAYACVRLASFSRVRVVNTSAGTVTSFVVTDPRGSAWQLGPIAPGQSSSRWMTFEGEGAVMYTATTQLPGGTVSTSGTVVGYMSNGMVGEYRVVTIQADGT